MFHRKRCPVIAEQPESAVRHPAAGFFACFAIITVFALFSCATGPHTFTTDPLGILGEDAAWYGIVPVAENWPILQAWSDRMENGEAMLENLDRASMLYLAGSPGTSGGAETSVPFRLVATGSFPPRMASMAFPSRKGWVKTTSPDGIWYRNGPLAAAIPRPGLLFIGSPSDIPDMLRNVQDPVEVSVRDEFRDLVPRSGTGTGTLAMYVRDGDLVKEQLMADSPFSLPITDLLLTIGTATKIVESPYTIHLRVFLPDERTTRAMLPLVRLIFTSDVRPEGNSLVLAFPADAEDIAEFVDFLYF